MIPGKSDFGAQKDFAQNNYWRPPEMFDIEELIKE